MNHFENLISELHHGIWNVLDDLLHDNEKRLVEDVIILLEHRHENRDQHGHKWHGIGLVLDNVSDTIKANLVMISQILVNQDFQHVVDGHGWISILLTQIELIIVNQELVRLSGLLLALRFTLLHYVGLDCSILGWMSHLVCLPNLAHTFIIFILREERR